MVKKQGAKRRPWNKDLEVGQKDAFTPAQVKRIRQVLTARGVSGLRDLALFQVAIDTMLHGSDLFNLTVKDVQLPNGNSYENRAQGRNAAGPMRLFQNDSQRTGKMDRRVSQEACRLPFPRPGHRFSSSNGGSTHEPSAEILDCRGGARSQELRQRILTTDKGSPHFERHRRFGDGSDAPRSRQDRINGEVCARAHNVRSNPY